MLSVILLLASDPLTPSDRVVAAAVALEPPIDELQRRALEHARLDDGALGVLGAGASLRATLPVLELAGGYSQTQLDESTILDEYSATSPWVIRGAGGTAAEVRVKLSWDLGKIAYNPEQLDVLALRSRQEELVTRVTRLHATRRRLAFDLKTLTGERERAEARVAHDELTAVLSALTGGWYQTELDRRAEARRVAATSAQDETKPLTPQAAPASPASPSSNAVVR